MGGRYLVSGTQLGVLISLSQLNPKKCNDEINKVIENQFLWESDRKLEDDLQMLRQSLRNPKKRKPCCKLND